MLEMNERQKIQTVKKAFEYGIIKQTGRKRFAFNRKIERLVRNAPVEQRYEAAALGIYGCAKEGMKKAEVDFLLKVYAELSDKNEARSMI